MLLASSVPHTLSPLALALLGSSAWLAALLPGWLAEGSGRPPAFGLSACHPHHPTHPPALPCPAYFLPHLPTLPQNLKGKQHFTSLHGKVGLLTFVLALASPALGTLSFRRLGLIQRFPEDWQPRLKWLHRLVSQRERWQAGQLGRAGQGQWVGQGGAAWGRAGQGHMLVAVQAAQRLGVNSPLFCARGIAAQVSAYAYVLGMVTMQLPLPHSAVFTGIWCRLWQVGNGWLARDSFVCVYQLLGSRLGPLHASRPQPCRQPSPAWSALLLVSAVQAGVAALAGCMLYVLRGRINGRAVLPSSGGSAAAVFQGPKHL